MKKRPAKAGCPSPGQDQVSELLILPDGQILVHNLTPAFAGLLHKLNPDDEQISSRLSRRNEAKADVTRQTSSASDTVNHPSPPHEPCCSVSTLQGAQAPRHAKAWTPNALVSFRASKSQIV